MKLVSTPREAESLDLERMAGHHRHETNRFVGDCCLDQLSDIR